MRGRLPTSADFGPGYRECALETDDMVLPHTAEYALRATIHLAQPPRHRPVRVGDLAEATGVPRNYLAKTLHQLVREGVLRSTRGPAGGFALAEPPERLTLARIIAPFAVGGRRCLLGRGECGTVERCAAHERWRPAAAAVEAFFGATTLADLVGNAERRDGAAIRGAGPPAAIPPTPTVRDDPARLP
jgi:Rrf2 family protein